MERKVQRLGLKPERDAIPDTIDVLQFERELAGVIRELDGSEVTRGVEPFMDQRHGLHALLAVEQGLSRQGIAGSLRLHI